MFIHPPGSQTYNQITNLCAISTFKQVETGDKILARYKGGDWDRDYKGAQDKSVE